MCDREQRGLAIAATSKIVNKGGYWAVPSATGQGKYFVRMDESVPHCSCPDHETNGGTCKHIYAVKFVIQRELFADGTETETKSVTVSETVIRKPTYKQDWPAYNAAQVNEKAVFQTLLGGLCGGIVEPYTPPGRGRPRIPMSDAIFSAAFKVYSTVSGRRFMTDLREAHEAGRVARLPHYNSIFHILESDAVTPVLLALIQEASKPLKAIESTFACDASGFSTSRFERWFDHKWGGVKSKREFVKAHIMCGCKTNVVTAIEISPSGDAPQLPGLLAKTRKTFTVKEVCADLAYSSVDNLQTIADAGADHLIPFKSNAVDDKGGIWAKAFHYFCLHRDEFLARYHQRSNVESTFSMVKAKFGDSVRSKTDTAMKNEVLCKFLCHNICCLISAIYELGLTPMFWGEVATA